MSKGTQTRRRVLEHAADQASVVGLEGLTIGGLADEVGLSKSGLFGHFNSKEALQLAVLEHAIELVIDGIIKPALKAPRGEPRLRELFERRLAWDLDPPWPGGCITWATLGELDDRPGPLRDSLAGHQQEWLDLVARVVEGGISEGHFAADTDPAQAAYEFTGIFWTRNVQHRLLGDTSPDHSKTAFEHLLDRIRA